MFVSSHPDDVVIHAMSIRLAKECRGIVQTCLREEEWADADLAFYEIIRQGLQELHAAREARP